jgi:SAM-dependent methyltransferase
MRIRCTPARVYADLAHDPRAELNESLRSIVEPGMRVLLLGAGTGRLGDDLGCLAGPSGGVVCLDADEESARFAQRRYPRPNTAFEAGDVKDLAGEVDGAFDAVVVVETTPRGEAEARTAAGELLRVTAPGSRLVLAVPAPGPGEPTTGPGHAGIRGAIELLEDQSDAPGPEAGARVEPPERIGGWLVIVATRTEREPEV